METYKIIKITDKPELIDQAALWFHQKWKVSKDAYLASMEAALQGDPVQQWYLCLDHDRIIAGMGVIENDFHDRKDLSPNVCAVYTEKEYRRQGICKRMLDFVVKDNREKGISPLYLITDHVGLYEKYGWDFCCMVQSNGELSRMYMHR